MEQRTPGGLVLPGTFAPKEGNGHASASQRREAALKLQLALADQQIRQLQAGANHYLSLVAILVERLGGKTTIAKADFDVRRALAWDIDEKTQAVTYSAKPHIEDEPPHAAEKPAEAPPS